MILAVFIIALIIIGVGIPLVLLLSPKQNTPMTLGTSYVLGLGLFTFLMFVTNLAGVKFTLLNELILLFIVSVPLVFLTRNRILLFFKKLKSGLRKHNLAPVEKVLLGGIVFIIISSFAHTFYWPVYLWDSVVLYDFRAHVFAITGFMKAALIDNYYTDYPLLTSLGHTIIYLAGGKYPQFIHSLFFASLGITFYGGLREFISRKASLFFTFILLITGPLYYHSIISYTNLPYAVYLSLGAIYLYFWDKKKQTGYLILSALLTSLSTWTRSVEPFWLGMFLVVIIVSIYRKKIRDILIYALFFFPIHEAWKVFQGSLLGREASTTGEIAGYAKLLINLPSLKKLGLIAGYLYKYVVVPWGAIFIVFLLACISLFILKKQRKLFLIFFITFSLLGVLFFGTMAFSIVYPGWFGIGDAAERLSMIFYPMFIFCIALVLQDNN